MSVPNLFLGSPFANDQAGFSALARSANDAIICSDDRDRIIFWNEAASQIFGYRENEALGGPVVMLIPKELRSAHRDGVRRVLEGGVANIIGKTVEVQGIRKDCEIFPMELTISTWDKDKKTFFSAIIRDITQRKHIEEEFTEAKIAAENANLAKSQFLSSMSHELRTPMNAILGFAQMLEYNPKEPLTEAQKGCVDCIMKGGQHLLELINDILDLARIEADKVGISIEDIMPIEIINECLLLITTMAEDRGIAVSVAESAVQGLMVSADHIRFKQVLLNLLSNAVKYNRENGKITINIEKSLDDTMLRIAVTDTGKGIPNDRRNELFKPFNRLGVENSGIEGTGIGLVICKKLMKLMDGVIGLESEAGKGSTFWIELPLAKRDHDQVVATTDIAAVQAARRLPGISGNLLYVEDNPDNVRLMELIVSRIEGLSMISADTGELGIELARAEQPDIIILDINLPGMSGLEAMRELRHNKDTKAIPVLALTAAATGMDIKNGMEAGFLRYLIKPIKVPEIVDAINAVLG